MPAAKTSLHHQRSIVQLWTWILAVPFVKKMEWGGALTGLSGAWLVAANVEGMSGYGFVAYLVSNLFWVVYGLKQKAWGMVVQQVGFTGSSLLGIYRWLM